LRAAFAALFLRITRFRKTVGINPSLIIALRISGKDTILKTLKAGTKYYRSSLPDSVVREQGFKENVGTGFKYH
jgi:hypothetical protein